MTTTDTQQATMTPEQAAWFADTFTRLVDNVGLAVLGKPDAIRLAFTCLLSGGHMLLEDFPGTGKTSLARALAATVQSSHSRIQFTPDLLPSDVTGVTIFDQESKRFEFHQGPIFASIVLADEINRASPKTQSALLEVMEEGRVTIDGTPHDVGRPFLVIATQNPIEQAGTYRLPEAQLDRFLMKSALGYPDHAATLQILSGAAVRDRTATLAPMITAQAVVDMADLASTVYVDAAVLEYVSRLAEQTRNSPEITLGVSVRGALALVRSAKTWAASQGRHYVVPDDVKDLAQPVLAHRLVLDAEAEFEGATATLSLARILSEVVPPQQRAGVEA
ncbi:ATPase associated with various cellular activities AAA_3 [Beutenbergia cavernae DSM 12333]|uniref:ATPase associated with various cellular activities AAA_3 n=1 Tax=Beutenbergia cavernae (strain ATCC BAA-8 / DSM 12333 / CCUG 43141 / JCM 11478 / NBRC 16432 / NCIMB 13614 / HKI 0122) TaxID=471853 RepID=C5C4N8_BEUC1|nr:MoxR family ATPase [Beutenbergia cavernae]ACQ80016.1 ATPase associated with various cellular activities AAA_3 [Beutenbergia cavernae DSM 12333]